MSSQGTSTRNSGNTDAGDGDGQNPGGLPGQPASKPGSQRMKKDAKRKEKEEKAKKKAASSTENTSAIAGSVSSQQQAPELAAESAPRQPSHPATYSQVLRGQTHPSGPAPPASRPAPISEIASISGPSSTSRAAAPATPAMAATTAQEDQSMSMEIDWTTQPPSAEVPTGPAPVLTFTGEPVDASRPSVKRKRDDDDDAADTWQARAGEMCSDWISKGTRGHHVPSKKVIKQWNRSRRCEVFIRPAPREKEKPTTAENEKTEDRRTWTFKDFTFKYNLDHQAPGLFLCSGDYQTEIRYGNFYNNEHTRATDSVFGIRRLAEKSMADDAIDKIRQNMQELGQDPSDDYIKALVDFATTSTRINGLHMVSFATTGRFVWEYKSQQQKPGVERLLDLLNTRDPTIKDYNDDTPQKYIVTIVRQHQEVSPVLEKYWHTHVMNVLTKGAWPFYAEFDGKKDGDLFTKYIRDPKLNLRRQSWMQERSKTESAKRFRSQTARKTFGSTREWAIINGATLLYEGMAEDRAIGAYFTSGIAHQAIVKKMNFSGSAALEVSVNRSNIISMPSVKANTPFKLGVFPPNDVEKAASRDVVMEDVESTTPRGEANKFADPQLPPIPTLLESVGQWRARCIEDDESKSDFVIQVEVAKDYRQHFRKGATVHIALMMKRNTLPMIRKLKAIDRIARRPAKKGDQRLRREALQQVMRGEGPPLETRGPSVVDQAREVLAKDPKKVRQLNAFNEFFDRTRIMLSASQQAAWDHTFLGRKFITMIQGPSGTGKTLVLGATGYAFGLSGHKTVMGAPTRVASMKLFSKVKECHEQMIKENSGAYDWFNVVYFPSDFANRATTKEFGSLMMAADAVAQEDKKYQLIYHILKRVKRTIDNGVPPGKSREEWDRANRFIDNLDAIRRGNELPAKVYDELVDTALDEIPNIMKDPKTKIIIGTCNTLAQLADMSYTDITPPSSHKKSKKPVPAPNENAFAVDACVVDDISLASETDCLPPLSLGAAHIVVGGDHQQHKPTARRQTEFSLQKEMSLFERLADGIKAPLFRLA